ncbi:hypothetical protein A1Q2_06695 [Trichosporon asahii var. asahii CBS 8904]|uniref:Pathogen-related protein n=1 Tax=Trichosporon asahii var. asahii (strain CBS 8904) TaxID=1220162 RepID=K1VII1_TRIAC|nr:hypothetical protein A1Q2_06695 [Trichosporon asahii var. asahii CBS 8904]
MSLPDLATNPDAVLGDDVAWRFKRAPDYSKTRKYFEESECLSRRLKCGPAGYQLECQLAARCRTEAKAREGGGVVRGCVPPLFEHGVNFAAKTQNHEPGSLPSIVENLVKNWEIEASYKTNLKEWRTIDPDNYTFSVNGGPNIPGEKMIQIGTYNALLTDSNFYSPEHNDFTDSHKVFKRMMPVFAWEVLEVYSGPPTVAFRWRHWGEMKNDYVGMNRNGQRVRVKAHGETLSIEGMLVAKVNDKLQIQHIDCWMDPLALFDEVTKNGAEIIVENTPESENAPKCPFASARM